MNVAFSQSEALCFEPYRFLWMDDAETGKRLLALVLEHGDECVLYLDDYDLPTPLPIFAALNPVLQDDCEILLKRIAQESETEAQAFADLIEEIASTLAPYDDLTFMRGVCWAFEHQAWDLDAAVHSALLAGDRARECETWMLEQMSDPL